MSFVAGNQVLSRQLPSFFEGNPPSCLHIGDALRDGVTIMLSPQSFHRLAMGVALNKKIRAVAARVYDFK